VKILVVEDDPGIFEVLEYALQAAGHEVLGASRGAEALEKVPLADCLVLDVGLPDFDGFEVCRRLRKTSAIPVLFLTSRSDEIDRVVGLEIGGDDYLAKPFSTRELLARIKAIMRRFVRAPAADTPPSISTRKNTP
jgi:DNA-binding response OmpR family regulator